MADKRMFNMKIIDSDAFLDMPTSAQALYFHLGMRADDDGFVNNPKKIKTFVGAADDDLKLLIAKNFLIPFESGVVVIKHWRIHNYIQKDRYTPTAYTDEMAQLEVKDNKAYTRVSTLDTDCVQDVHKVDAQIRLDKSRLDKIRLVEGKKPPQKRFMPPTLDEVKDYCLSRGSAVDPNKFWDYYQAGDWHDAKGQPVRNWKQKLLTWERDETQKPAQVQRSAKRGLEREIVDDWDAGSIMNRPRG